MCLRIKTLSRSDWARILKRKYTHKFISDQVFTGDVGLILMEEITAPLVKTYDSVSVTIVDRGYYWLQLAPKDKKFWVAAMINQQGEIVQYYCDITDKNEIHVDGESYFYDMYLDVVLLPDGKVILLDEEEIDTALKRGAISQLQYEEAYNTARMLMSELPKNGVKLKEYCMQTFYKLKAELPD